MNKLFIVSLFFLGLFSASACDESRPIDPESKDSDQKNDTNTGSNEKDSENLTCAPASTVVETHGHLQVIGPDLMNECGEPVRLKGVSSMWLNWENDGYAESKAAMQWMIDNWKISIIRAAMGIEPAGAYMSTETAKQRAINQVKTIVNNAIELGIYVLIDWHSHNASDADQKAAAIEFFTMMATEYGQYPNVLYETWNEPLQQDWATVIKPYHEELISAIRKVDSDNIIILGTPQWCQLPDVAIDNPVDGTNLMYTVHFYSCTHQSDLSFIMYRAYRRGVPIFVTEWGATPADGGASDRRVCEPEAEEWMELLDEMNASHIAWKLDGCQDTSCLFRAGAPVDGPWTSDWLQGHGPYVVSKLLED